MTRPALLALLLLAGPASAHEMAAGLDYPLECCSGRDCRPVVCDQLEEIGAGRIRDIDSGTVYAREQVRPSPNGQCHLCTAGGHPKGAGICAFVVNGS